MAADRPLLRRHRIVVAARAIVAEGGIDALSLRRLADRLDVSPAALYAHIEGKDDLLRAIAEAEQEQLEERVAAAAATAADADERRRLRSLARLEAAEAEPELHRLVARHAPEPEGVDDLELALCRLVDGLALSTSTPARRRAALEATLDRLDGRP